MNVIYHRLVDENNIKVEEPVRALPPLDWKWMLTQFYNTGAPVIPESKLCIDCNTRERAVGRRICQQCRRKRGRDSYHVSGATTVQARKKLKEANNAKRLRSV